MRGCLELMGNVTGELQQQQRGGGDLHLHRHIHTGGAMPKTEIEIDLEIAKQVACGGFRSAVVFEASPLEGHCC